MFSEHARQFCDWHRDYSPWLRIVADKEDINRENLVYVAKALEGALERPDQPPQVNRARVRKGAANCRRAGHVALGARLPVETMRHLESKGIDPETIMESADQARTRFVFGERL